MARVTVRAFAALRELVGPTREVEADDVASLLAALGTELGPEFTRRLERSNVVVDDRVVEHGDTSPLADGSEIVLLPPFAGG